jgi:hypothetical protein
MAGHSSDHVRGEMNITEQVSTFNLVMGMTKWGSLAIAALVFFLVLWFCTATGFVGAFGAAAILLAAGIFFLREKKDAPAH